MRCKDRCPPYVDFCAAKINGEGFFGLVVIAQVKHPVPSRTRQLSTVAPMVLRLKAWESRSPPNLVRNWVSAQVALRAVAHKELYLSNAMFNTELPPFGAVFFGVGGICSPIETLDGRQLIQCTRHLCLEQDRSCQSLIACKGAC